MCCFSRGLKAQRDDTVSEPVSGFPAEENNRLTASRPQMLIKGVMKNVLIPGRDANMALEGLLDSFVCSGERNLLEVWLRDDQG